MMNRNALGVAEPRRGHRVAGPVAQRKEERHWTIGTILTAVAIGVAVVGAGVTAYAASEAAAAQRETAKREEEFRKAQAQSAMESAAFAERQQRRRASLLLAKQNAIYTAAGVDPSQGSPLLLEVDSAKQAELEALNIRRGGAVGGFEQEFEARMARLRGSFAPSGGAIAVSGLGSAASQSSSILSSWARYGGKYPSTSPYYAGAE